MAFRNLLQPRGSVVAVANNDAVIPLLNGVQTLKLIVALTATLTVGTAALQNIIGRGSLSQAVRIAVIDAGQDRIRVEGKDALFIAQCFAPSSVSETRQTATAVAAYPLSCTFPVWFSSPYAANPMEAAFLESNTDAVLQFGVYLKSATAATYICTAGGGGTAVLGNVTCRVTQEVQQGRTSLPYYIPTMRSVTTNVLAANGEFEFNINAKNNRLRGILLTQDTDKGTVSDIIQGAGATNVGGVRLLGDNGVIIGPTLMNVDDIARAQEYEFGGTVFPAADANALASQQYANLFFHFQKWGKLSNLMDPRAYVNLRFVLNVAPTATAGATTSILRATLLEMERPNAVGNRQYVAELPAHLA